MSLNAIIGDVHIGNSMAYGVVDSDGVNSRVKDFAKSFGFAIDESIKAGCTKIILTGDLFKNKKPTAVWIDYFLGCVAKAVDVGIEVCIVSGNHDLLNAPRITIMSAITKMGSNIKVYDDYGTYPIDDKYDCIICPYNDKNTLKLTSNEEVMKYISGKIKKASSSTEKKKLAVVHGISSGTYLAKYEGAEVDTLMEPVYPLDLWTNNDIGYVFFGHVHKFSIIKKFKPTVVNVGSVDKSNFAEAGNNNKFVIFDTETEAIKYIDIPTREFLYIKGKIKSKKDFDSLLKMDVKTSITKIVLEVAEKLEHVIELDKINKVLEESYFNAGVVVNTTKEENAEDDVSYISECMTVRETLKEYLEKNFAKNNMESIYEKGVGIIEEVQEE